MKLLIDTNVIMDFLEKRDGAEFAKKLFELAENDAQYECLTSSSVTDILYLFTKVLKDSKEGNKTNKEIKVLARIRLERFLSLFHILAVSEQTIKEAFSLAWTDTEDALQYAVAKENNVDIIITKNKKDYEKSDIPLMTAQEFLDLLKKNK